MFIDMENSPSDYLQDMLVSESLSGVTYTEGGVEWVVLDSFITTEIFLVSEIN